MKYLVIFIIGLLLCSNLKAQLYINSDITIQKNATLYADDTIKLAASSAVTTNGILQSTKSIITNGYVINTDTSGYIITPIASGVSKTFDIGTTSNNKIQIQHSTGSAVTFQLAVRDNVYNNPQTHNSTISSNVVKKTWYMAPQSSVSSLSGTVYWNSGDEASSFSRTTCGVSYWQSGTSTSWSFTNGTSSATTTGSSPSYSKTGTATTLSSGTYFLGVGGSGSSLPVTLLTFDATKNKNEDVLLKWITTSEINNDHFELGRSVDGSQFTVFAIVKGAGNSNTQLIYSYKDETPFAKLNATKLFYRLKQVDFDGKYTYTDIKEVDLQKAIASLAISVYPNPNKDVLNIDLETSQPKNVSIQLFDATGKNIINKNCVVETGKQTFQINTQLIAPGVYLLNIIDENNASVNKQKLIIY